MVDLAYRVLEKYWQGECPVNVVSIAKKIGIDVRKAETENYSVKTYSEQQQVIIELRNNDSLLRQRYALAHAIGHVVLGHLVKYAEIVDTVDSFSLKGSKLEEQEANGFATQLLIPRILLDHLIFKKNMTSITALSKALLVSEVAVKYRLDHIDYFNGHQRDSVDMVDVLVPIAIDAGLAITAGKMF